MNGQELLTFRKEMGLSRKKFVEKVSFSLRTLQNLEGHKNKEIPDKYKKIIEESFQVDEDLLTNIKEHLKRPEDGVGIKFDLDCSDDEIDRTISKLASKGTDEATRDKVTKETEDYLKKFLNSLDRDIVIKIYALYIYVTDDVIPIYKKFSPIGALAYFISPIDAIPDVIPFVGLVDDIGVIVMVVAMLANSEDFKKCLVKSEKELIKKGYIKIV